MWQDETQGSIKIIRFDDFRLKHADHGGEEIDYRNSSSFLTQQEAEDRLDLYPHLTIEHGRKPKPIILI